MECNHFKYIKFKNAKDILWTISPKKNSEKEKCFIYYLYYVNFTLLSNAIIYLYYTYFFHWKNPYNTKKLCKKQNFRNESEVGFTDTTGFKDIVPNPSSMALISFYTRNINRVGRHDFLGYHYFRILIAVYIINILF